MSDPESGSDPDETWWNDERYYSTVTSHMKDIGNALTDLWFLCVLKRLFNVKILGL